MEVTLKDGRRAIIRQAEPNDAAAMIEYLKYIGGESDNLTFRSEEITISVEDETEKIRGTVENPHAFMIMAFIDGTLAGNLTFAAGSRERTCHAGEFGISVRKDFWGIGLGKAMLENLFQWAVQEGNIKKINLQVRTDNLTAIQLYLKMGFQMEGRIRRAFLIDGVYVDTYTMGKEL